MSMTDIYQPAVILHLLEHGGTATTILARTWAEWWGRAWGNLPPPLGFVGHPIGTSSVSRPQEPAPMANTPNFGERGRFSASRKAATVLRLLRGESLELLARELGVTAATLAGWRDDFLAGGQAALKSRPTDDRDDEIARLRAKVGELTMDNELLLQRCQADRPFVPTRRKR